MPISLTVSRTDGLIAVYDEQQREIIHWNEEEWTQDRDKVYEMVNLVFVGRRYGSVHLRRLLGIPDPDENTVLRQVLEEMVGDGQDYDNSDDETDNDYSLIFEDPDGSPSLTSNTNDWIRYSPFDNPPLPSSRNNRQTMETAALMLAEHHIHDAGVYNTGGSVYCLVVNAGGYEFVMGDSHENSWGLDVNDETSGEHLGSRDLGVLYTADPQVLANELAAFIRRATTNVDDLGLEH